ncbi:MAG TPA: molecular chaperone HtpG [Polyangia bacterium]|nr:molecular chaperone HtpG [Polyangia bacterium]
MTSDTTTPGTTTRETHRFQAEVHQVLHLVIHSLYSHKEIFLRELISNASDALDKLRFRAITEPDLLRDEPTLEIRLVPDRERGTLTIEDTGIGMSREELAENLGTIAHSGSRAFLEAVARARQESAAGQGDKAGKPGDDVNLIGQFGVGFYSAYLVADRVEVVSRPASAAAGEAPQAYAWTSDGKDSYTLEPADGLAHPGRGTSVILHLKESEKHFLDEWELRDLVKRYSDYVSHPIKLKVAPKAGEPTADVTPKFETINQASALWRRARTEITDEQYNEFYQHLTHDWEKPLGRTHFRVEGTQEFVGLLFLPRHAPWDLNFERKRRGVRLFVRRVFVMDDCEELLPEWLRFVRGVIDSDDLPLNVSRELLQDSSIVRGIRKQVIKKTLDLLEETARERAEDYLTFWKAFGAVFKAGVHFDADQKSRIAPLLLYRSTHGEGYTSLKDYVARMPSGQEAIYYVFGDSEAVLAGSPHLEALRKRGYEVLYMTDPVDEWVTESLNEFEGKKLVSAMRADLKLEATEEEKKAREADRGAVGPLLERMRSVLQEHVQEVRASDRLVDSPCCLVVPEGAHHAAFDRLLRSHGHTIPQPKRILEVNPSHPLIVSLQTIFSRDANAPRVGEWIEMLYDQALLTEGSPITDPHRFARRVTSLLSEAAQVAAGAPAGATNAPGNS